MIFIYRNWVSTRWQPSIKLYKNRKDTAIYMCVYIYIYKMRNNKKTQNTQNGKQTKKIFKKQMSSN